ncbi:MAG: hypothetical protein KF772_06255 [Cryobacterium sp.]|nr:hypothetical protein [Cryobacterium sp.]MBX3116327.1 hypothetical protein [Cryobacterium sp.]MCC7127914.1 hypothetical protein [Microbacteriaceae bacterium]MCO5293510.1 hypothetical protein [Homoserinimonas sp.]MCW5944557.1 hypothetical protein [Cryobacterium sp.]
MNLALVLLELATPTPEPGVDQIVEAPGWIGFAATAFVVLASLLLILDMNRRIRRSRYREEVRNQIEAEQARATKSKPSGKKGEAPRS